MGTARVLSRKYHVITYDLRGHGRSGSPQSGYTLEHMTDDLRALLDHVGVERVHLVGHSFGARIALCATIQQPERIASLTVADSQLKALQRPIRLREWPYWQTWKRQLRAQGYNALPSDEKFINFRLLSYVSQLAPEAATGEMAVSRYRPSLRKRDMGKRGASRWQELMSDSTSCDELEAEDQITVKQIERISVPTLAVYGEHSHCLPSCHKLSKLLPNCHVVVVTKAGHFHPAVRPRVFSRVLHRFLSGRMTEARRRRRQGQVGEPPIAGTKPPDLRGDSSAS
jgi:pimeloyl-ACP methyl ester carboxylesterase